jgi:transposase
MPRNETDSESLTSKRRGRRPADEALVVALASGMTTTAAAKRIGLSRATVARRLRNPAFRQRVTEARDAMLQRALGRLSAAATKAVVTLSRLLKSQDEKTQLGAARAVLEYVRGMREHAELGDRLAEIERRLDETPTWQGNGERGPRAWRDEAR